MTEGSSRPRLLGPIGRRLAAAFLLVALLAVAVQAGLTLIAARREVSALVGREQREQAVRVSAALARAYAEAGGWQRADLSVAEAIATDAGGAMWVFDPSGAVLGGPGRGGGRQYHQGQGPGQGRDSPPGSGSSVRASVVVGGEEVGVAELRFPAGRLPAAERQVRDALSRSILLAALLAALLAGAVALFVSRRITRPLVTLQRAAQAVERGDLRARTGRFAATAAPGELGELARAFDRMAAALARQDRLRRVLVADIAHELRTPVTILRGSCEELVDGLAEPTPARIVSLHDEVLRLGRLVDDLETLSAAEAAGLQLQRRPVDLAEVTADAVDLLRPQYEAAGVELTADLTSVRVDGDPTRLHQVVGNLLTNAAKFTPAGGRVAVTVAPDDGTARLEVLDTGPGVPPEELPYVFERFWRGRAAAGTSGTGIGLAVVAELVHAHGGRVEAANQAKGRPGSRFTVSLPREAG